MIWPLINSGKYGPFICNIANPEISKYKQHKTIEISMIVHDLVRNKVVANVTISDIIHKNIV